MKKIFWFFILILSVSKAVPQSSVNMFITKKSYYNQLFNVNERERIAGAIADMKKADKYWRKYNKFKNKANRFDIKHIPMYNKRKQKRYQRKYNKFMSKSVKFGIKALNIQEPEIDIITKIFAAKYSNLKKNVQKDDTLKFIEKKLDEAITKNLHKIDSLGRYHGTSFNIQNNFKIQNNILKIKCENLLNYQYFFALRNNDNDVIRELLKMYPYPIDKKVKNEASEQTYVVLTPPKYIKKYDANKDQNLVKYENNLINMKISADDKKNLAEVYKYNLEGNKYLAAADSLLFVVNFYNKQLQSLSVKDKENRKLLTDTIAKIKKLIKENRRKGWLNYILANQWRYRIYHTKLDSLSKHINKKSFKSLIDSAELWYNKSQKIPENTLIQLVAKNRNLLIANEYNIAAFSLYYNGSYKPVSLIPKVYTQHNQQKPHSKSKPKKKHKTHKVRQNNKKSVQWLYTYSSTHRKPKKVYEKGNYYRVYIGYSTSLLPTTELPDYEPYYYIQEEGSKVKYFYVGSYKSEAEAKRAAAELKQRGYPTKVVLFVDGKIGKHPVNQCITPVEQVSEPTVQYPDITKTKYLIYAIQIGTFSSPKTKDQLKNLSPIYQKILSDGRIQYYLAPIYSYSDAENKLQIVKNKGFDDAIIVAYNNGKRISLTKAKKIENSVKQAKKVIYRVQIGAFSDYLSDTQFKEHFGKISSLYPIYTYVKDGMVIYSAGNAENKEEALNILRQIKNMGYKDAFIIEFRGNKLIK